MHGARAPQSLYLYTWGFSVPSCLSVLWLNPTVGWLSSISGVDPVLSCPVLCSQRVNGAVCEYGLPAGLGAGAGEAVWDAEPSSGGGAEVMCRHPAPPPPQHAGKTETPPPFQPTLIHFFHRNVPRIFPWSEHAHPVSSPWSSPSHLCGLAGWLHDKPGGENRPPWCDLRLFRLNQTLRWSLQIRVKVWRCRPVSKCKSSYSLVLSSARPDGPISWLVTVAWRYLAFLQTTLTQPSQPDDSH